MLEKNKLYINTIDLENKSMYWSPPPPPKKPKK